MISRWDFYLLNFPLMKPTVSLAFQIMPKVDSHTQAIELIDTAIEIIKKSGVSYEVGPMETTMEGENLDELLAIVKKAKDVCLRHGAHSVFINMKVLCNPSGTMTIHEKTAKHRK